MGLLSKIGDKLGGSSSAEQDERSEVDHNQPGSHLRHPIQSHTGPTGTAVSHSTDPSTSFSSSTQPGGQYAAPGSYPSESTREGYSSSQPLSTSGDHGLASHGQIHGSSTGASGLTGHTGQHQSSTRSDYPTSSHSGNEGLASTGTGIASSGSGIGSTGSHSQSGTSHTGAHGIGSTSVDDSVPRSKHGGITNTSQTTNTPAPDFGPTSGKENLHAIPTAGGQKVGTGVDAAETPYGAQPQHGNDLHDSHSGSHGHSHHARHHEAQEHHLARDAAVAATGGAGAGVGAHEYSKHGDHHQHGQGSTLDQKYPHAAGQTGQGLSGLTGQQGQSTIHHSGHGEHHGARDAALGAGALGVAGHEAGKHNTHSHSTTSGLSSSTGSQLPGRSEYSQPSTSQVGHSGQLASQEHTGHSHHQRHHDAQQHHGARDTALGAGAGAGAAGIAAHELSHHGDHSTQRDQAGQYPSQTTSHHSGPLSSHHTQSSSQPFTSDLSTQQAGRDYDPYRDTSSKKDLTDPANVSYMNRSAIDPHGSSSVPHGQTGANFAGSNVATDLPHHPKPSHLGQEAGLAGGAGALAGAGLAEGKHHGRYDSATQHNLTSGSTAAQTAGGQTTHSDADLPPHISGFLHAQKVGGQYEAGYRAALAHLHQAKQLGV